MEFYMAETISVYETKEYELLDRRLNRSTTKINFLSLIEE